ncbi:MAG: peptidoglycan DD-metalloendopeptidase family protein [Bacteroidales bacterium]|nr:peptidoglycan DD-metalloendopeptidase family protein [Bacteroidales bacterium]
MTENKKHIVFLVLVITLGLLSGIPVQAQNSLEKLKQKRADLEKQINYTNQLISKVSSDKKNTLYSLRLLNNKVQKRQELSATLKKEVLIISDTIDNLQIDLKKLNQRLDQLKTEYARIAEFVYKHNSPYTRLAFLFASSDINQAYQRLRYLSEISAYIRTEADRIEALEKRKGQKVVLLNSRVTEKKQLLDQEVSQLSLLELEQKRKNQLKSSLQNKESHLRSQLADQRHESSELNKKIQAIIAKAIADKNNVNYPETPAGAKLSSSFYASKGKLPWPVSNGIVSQTFGVHNHPVIKHVKIRNNGINISTSKGSDALAIFPGTVVSVVPITNTNIAVIVQHGSYFTVYSMLGRSFVRTGDKIKAGQKLGVIHTSLQGDTELHFELWKGKQFQNPASWLSTR